MNVKEEAVIKELHDEIIGSISPILTGNLMMKNELLDLKEYERVVMMRGKSSESEQNSYLLTCLVKRPAAGSLAKFREILVELSATLLEEKIGSKLLG